MARVPQPLLNHSFISQSPLPLPPPTTAGHRTAMGLPTQTPWHLYSFWPILYIAFKAGFLKVESILLFPALVVLTVLWLKTQFLYRTCRAHEGLGPAPWLLSLLDPCSSFLPHGPESTHGIHTGLTAPGTLIISFAWWSPPSLNFTFQLDITFSKMSPWCCRLVKSMGVLGIDNNNDCSNWRLSLPRLYNSSMLSWETSLTTVVSPKSGTSVAQRR